MINKFQFFTPLMHEYEYKFIEKYLNENDILLEWGSGNSTIYFSGIVKSVISLEHDIDFYNSIKNTIKVFNISNIDLIHIAAHFPEPNPSRYEQFKDYIDYPSKNNLKFTKVLIDGRGRKYCAFSIVNMIDENTIVFIHDFNREEYQGVLEYYDIIERITDGQGIVALRKKKNAYYKKNDAIIKNKNLGIKIKDRYIKVFSCYQKNISQNIVNLQKEVFDVLKMPLTQELTILSHPQYMDNKMINEDFDIMIFIDIDCIPLQPNLYEYIVDQISDDNSLIGIEQAANHIDSNLIYAGPACFAITKKAFEKLGKPSFIDITDYVDTGQKFTFLAQEKGVNVKLFNITSSQNKKWKCGNKWFGNGTIYDDRIYHQFEIRYFSPTEQNLYEQQFILKCKEVIKKYSNESSIH